MADILIKGLDMPTKGNPLTVLIYPDGTATWKDHEYQAVPVPPHGRLIDADELESRWTPDAEYYPTDKDRRAYLNGRLTVRDFQSSIHDAKTIIPASEVYE